MFGSCRLHSNWLLLFVVGIFWSATTVVVIDAQAQQDATPAGPIMVESHLILQGCKESKPSGFWISIKNQLTSRIQFDSITCVASREEEWDAANRLAVKKMENPDGLEIHVVAALLTSNHCVPDAVCPPENLGEAYIPLLQIGIVGWFIEFEPNFERLGLNRTELNIQSTELFPDNAAGGREVGQEFCRVATSIAPATIVVLYGHPDASHSTVRVQSFIEGMQEYCPEARHVVKYSFHADWSSHKAAAILSPIFLRDGSINAVFAANDDMALGALVSARQMRPDKRLLVGGYDANDYTKPLLASGEMFATVNQNPPNGLVYSLETLLSDKATGAGNFGQSSSCSMNPGSTCRLSDYNDLQRSAWSQLISSLPNKVSTAVSIRVKDPSTIVLRERLLLYNPVVPPGDKSNLTRVVPVVAELKNFQIYEIDAARQSTFGQGLLVLSWTDSRLGWSPVDFPDTEFVRVDIDTIWHPVVVFTNRVNNGDAAFLQTIRSHVFSDGRIVWEQSMNSAEYRCESMDETLLHFPFDRHLCGVDLTSYSVEEFTLLPTVTSIPTNVSFDVTITNDDWEQGEAVVSRDLFENKLETIHFRVGMTRDATFVTLAMVIPSFLLNIISFAQFWIPAQSETINLDRGGMAITTILASLALRESTVSEVDTAFTLLDVFLLLSLLFHFIGFLVTAYESSYQQVKRRTGLQLGSGDKLGKLFLPMVFGVVNMILAILWAKTVWVLFYLSLAEVIGCVLVNRKARQHVRKVQAKLRDSLTNRSSIKERLGFMGGSIKKGGEDGEEGEQVTQAADPASIIRFMKWKAVAKKELASRENNNNDDEGKADDNIAANAEEPQQAPALQLFAPAQPQQQQQSFSKWKAMAKKSRDNVAATNAEQEETQQQAPTLQMFSPAAPAQQQQQQSFSKWKAMAKKSRDNVAAANPEQETQTATPATEEVVKPPSASKWKTMAKKSLAGAAANAGQQQQAPPLSPPTEVKPPPSASKWKTMAKKSLNNTAATNTTSNNNNEAPPQQQEVTELEAFLQAPSSATPDEDAQAASKLQRLFRAKKRNSTTSTSMMSIITTGTTSSDEEECCSV